MENTSKEISSMTLGEKIKKLRQVSPKTGRQIAADAGVKESTYYRWESGEIRKISWENIVKLAKALECDPNYLVDDSDNENYGDDVNPDITLLTEIAKRATPDELKQLIQIASIIIK